MKMALLGLEGFSFLFGFIVWLVVMIVALVKIVTDRSRRRDKEESQ